MLNDSQLAAFAAALAAESDAELVAFRNSGDTGGIANWYNAPSTVWVWRTRVPVDEYRNALVWTEVDGLTAGGARIWDWITGSMTLDINPSKTEIRQGIGDCWNAGTTTRTNLLSVGKRFASRLEAMFATGTGSEADPAVLDVEGEIPYTEVIRALAL